MDQLPLDILRFGVFRWLERLLTICACELVCKKWRDNIFYGPTKLIYQPRDIYRRRLNIRRAVSRLENLEELQIHNPSVGFTFSQIKTSVKVLTICDGRDMSWTGWILQFPMIHTLKLLGTCSTYYFVLNEVQTRQFAGLKDLKTLVVSLGENSEVCFKMFPYAQRISVTNPPTKSPANVIGYTLADINNNIQQGNVAWIEKELQAKRLDANWTLRVSARDGIATLLDLAVWHRKPDVIDLLLRYGSRPDYLVKDGYPALFQAAAQCDIALLEQFLDPKYDTDLTRLVNIWPLAPNYGNDYCHTSTSILQHAICVQRLKRRTNPSDFDATNNKPPVTLRRFHQTLTMLLERGASPTRNCGGFGNSSNCFSVLLHHDSCRPEDIETAKVLMKYVPTQSSNFTWFQNIRASTFLQFGSQCSTPSLIKNADNDALEMAIQRGMLWHEDNRALFFAALSRNHRGLHLCLDIGAKLSPAGDSISRYIKMGLWQEMKIIMEANAHVEGPWAAYETAFDPIVIQTVYPRSICDGNRSRALMLAIKHGFVSKEHFASTQVLDAVRLANPFYALLVHRILVEDGKTEMIMIGPEICEAFSRSVFFVKRFEKLWTKFLANFTKDSLLRAKDIAHAIKNEQAFDLLSVLVAP